MVSHQLNAMGMTVLIQGDETRHRLLNRFRRTKSPVLFGMDSFWEGVDIPGDQLSCVILTRLPFRVPSEPIQEARIEALKQAGLDSFTRLSLPQAVIKFKQGFGRLVRSKEDRGVVIVLDSRLVNKSYGQRFLDSLPGADLRRLQKHQMAAAVRDWFQREC